MSAENMTGNPEPEFTGELIASTVPSITTTPCLLRDEHGIRPGLIVVAAFGMGETDWAVAMYAHHGGHEWTKVEKDHNYAVIWPENLQVKQ